MARMNAREYDNLPIEDKTEAYSIQGMTLEGDPNYPASPKTWTEVFKYPFSDKSYAISEAKQLQVIYTGWFYRVYDLVNKYVVWPEIPRNKDYYTLEALYRGEWFPVEIDAIKEELLRVARDPDKVYRVVYELTGEVFPVI